MQILSFLFLLFVNPTNQVDLNVSAIPLELLYNANAVIRYKNLDCHIVSLEKVIYTEETAVTVLNENGDLFGSFSQYYLNGADKIKNIRIEILDSQGRLIKKVKKSEIDDVSHFDGFSLADDARKKVYAFTSPQYPYTIKYSYEKHSNNSLHIPSWYPVPAHSISVQESVYDIKSNIPDYKLLLTAHNTNLEGLTYRKEEMYMEAKNLKAIASEGLAPYFLSYAPNIQITPSKFNYYGIEGDFHSWNDYGNWVLDNMLADRGELPQELINELDQLIDSEQSPIEKAQVIYSYVVDKTRYVSIQLGIGGYQPFSCSDVHNLKYGDCKALSFYTQNIMHHYGIEAIYTELNSNRNYAISYDETLPGPGQGNHIILCLPNEGDTIWLDCTSKTLPFGLIPPSNDGRRVLIVKENESKLVRSQKPSPDDNLVERTIQINLGQANSAKIEMENLYFNQRMLDVNYIHDYKGENREQILRKYQFNNLSSYEILSYDLHRIESELCNQEQATIELRNYTETAGTYLMLPIDFIGFEDYQRLSLQRTQDIYIKSGQKNKFNFKIRIPSEYKVIDIDKEFSFENDFGNIQLTSKMLEDEIQVEIDIMHKAGLFSSVKVNEYNNFVDFLNKIRKEKIVLKIEDK